MPNSGNIKVPIGPQHPALKEPTSFLLTLDGERIVQTPQATGIISTPGVWPRTSIRILPPEEICDSDLIDLMKKL